MKPTVLESLAVRFTARAINPLLMAMDAKGKPVTVDYAPFFKGLTTKNLKDRKAKIVGDVAKAIKGKTIAKDATVEHLAHMLDQLEHTNEPKSLDESVSGEQHRAMEAAAHGHSNLGIPKSVGSEFEKADKGKSFDWDMLHDMVMKHGAMSEDAWEDFKKKASDEMPENALDEEEETKIEVEQGEDEIEEEEGEDGEIEEEEAEDKAAKDKAAKDKAAKDKAAKDRKGGAMDTKKQPITQDTLDKAIHAAVATERKNAEARAFVRPYVGEMPMALDSAEKVHRAAAVAMGIDDADKIHASALPTLIKTCGRKSSASQDGGDEPVIAQDSAAAKSFNERFPGADRIGTA